MPDLIGPGCKLLFVGINPGLWTTATQTHFCHPSNRFYPALQKAGLIDWVVDPSIGMSEVQRRSFTGAGLGITNLVPRATARASELETTELRRGGERLVNFVSRHKPTVIAVAGVTAYRTAFSEPKATLGDQELGIAGASLWVVPNPSGLNAHETTESLAEHYREVAMVAGVV